MTDTNDHSDEISLLDLLVVIAESWWIIVGGSLLAGTIAYFATASQPVVYSSSAELAAPPAQIEALLADLDIQSDVEARASGNNTAIVFKAASPERAETELAQFVEAATAKLGETSIAPARLRVESLTRRLNEIEALAGRADAALTGWQAQTEPDETAIAGMFQLQQQLQAERFALQEEAQLLAMQIDSIPQAMMVVPPSPAETGGGRSPVIVAALAAIGAGFLLMVSAFVRHGLRQSAGNPKSSVKLQRIKNALLLRRPTAN